jgi:hypothetical protein
MAATPGMIEITPKTTPKITPTSIATSLGTPDPATTTTMPHVTSDLVTTDLETISRNKRSALTPDIPKVLANATQLISLVACQENAPKTIERRRKIAQPSRRAKKAALNGIIAPGNCNIIKVLFLLNQNVRFSSI